MLKKYDQWSDKFGIHKEKKNKGSFKFSVLMRELMRGFNRFQGSESHTKQWNFIKINIKQLYQTHVS